MTNCFRYLNINDVERILDLTPRQYHSLMRGHSLQTVDERHAAHLQSWLDKQVEAQTGTGKNAKPKYRSFKDFFDYEKEVKRVEQQYEVKPISKEKVERFRASVREAERLLNGGWA